MQLDFNTTATQFSLTNARACALASQAAYSSPPTIQSELAHVLILDTPTARCIAFRGTANVQDAFTDCEVEKVALESGQGKVHCGFQKSVESVYWKTLEYLDYQDDEHNWKPLFICGHSLGGAQAVLFAERMSKNYKCQVYTFGQPRVGNGQFCRFMDKLLPNHYRLVLAEDIVTRSASALLGYRHSGEMIFLPSAGGIMDSPPLAWLLFSDIWGALRGLNRFSLTALEDHHVGKYVERLDQIG